MISVLAISFKPVKLQGSPMFEQSFTLTVKTDAQGRFHSKEPVNSPFSLDIKLKAAMQSPDGVEVIGTFSLANEECAHQPVEFKMSSGKTADLGKWRVVAGDAANLTTAEGHTQPPAPNTEVTVVFTATPSFF
jgi:hypothetical protein